MFKTAAKNMYSLSIQSAVKRQKNTKEGLSFDPKGIDLRTKQKYERPCKDPRDPLQATHSLSHGLVTSQSLFCILSNNVSRL